MPDIVSSLSKAAPTPDIEGKRPPLRPSWLYPLLASSVVLIHVAFFASGIYWPEPTYADLATLDAELVPEGDSLDAGDPAPEGDSLDVGSESSAEPAESEETEEAIIPPPPVMEPDPVPAPEKKRTAEKAANAEKKRTEKRTGPSPDKSRRANGSQRYGIPGGTGKGSGTARVAGRYGLPGGRGPAGGATQATCLAQVSASVRRHLPGTTSLGPGTAHVTFYVNPGGGISGISVSASSPAHAALARRIVASSRGPGSCGAAFASQSLIFE